MRSWGAERTALGQSITVLTTRKGNTTEADISNLPAGLYLVDYISGTDRTIGKFMKK